MVIACFHIVLSVMFLALVLRNLITGSKHRYNRHSLYPMLHLFRLEGGFEGLLTIVCLIASLLLVIGLKTENRKLILIYLYCQVILKHY